jgi:hypothetical protein
MQATKPTFSFGVVLLIALGLVGAVYYLSQQFQDQNLLRLPALPQNQNLANGGVITGPNNTIPPAKPVSTASWKQYNDSGHAVSFKYPENWQIQTYDRTDFDIIVLTPDSGKDHIRIYVSDSEYVGIAGLQTTPITVGGQKGVNANNMVVGVKQGNNFFTFDAGQDQQLLPEFKGILDTVAFNQ